MSPARALAFRRWVADRAPDVRDLHVYGGAALVAFGAGLYSPPAALILLGAVLLYLGLRKVRP